MSAESGAEFVSAEPVRAGPGRAGPGRAGPKGAEPGGKAVRPRRSRSLRLRLTLLSSALFALAAVAGAIALTGVVSASRVRALDDIVRERAVVVGRLVETGQLPQAVPASEPGEVAQVLAADGAVIATSANASRTLPVLAAGEISGALPADAGRDTPVSWTTTSSPYAETARVAALPVADHGTAVTVVVALPLGDVEGVVGALRVSLWGIVPVLTALVGVVVWVTTGRALRPVEELRASAEAIATSGVGSLPAPAHADEIGALARTLDDMLSRLRAAADRQQAFVADAAHELRSPVAALRAAVDVAKAHPGSYTVEEFAAQASEQVGRLQGLVDDLLVLARLGSRPPASEVVDLAKVAAEVVAAEQAEAGRHDADDTPGVVAGGGVHVIVDGSGRARGDQGAVARIVRNLVANARRHALSHVRVSVGDGCVTVLDDGPGIAVEDRERAFERFTRLDAARLRDDGGSGLGLAIARETARELGGDVTLTGADGGGLAARLTLPGPADQGAQ